MDNLNKSLNNILFLDIETVGITSNYNLLDDNLKLLWDKKTSYLNNIEPSCPKSLFEEKGGIYSEFGKIIVIGIGIITHSKDQELCIRVRALYDKDEEQLLIDFKNILEEKFSPNVRLCAHNGKEFDFPYICRRMTILGIKLPSALDISSKKPWEINHIDTMEMWKFGDRKAYTSLDLLATIFDIESSKSTMDGSQVHSKYYHEDELHKIAKYCMDDVVVAAQVFLKMNFLDKVKKENIIFL